MMAVAVSRQACRCADSEHRDEDEVGDRADGGAEGEMVGERGLRDAGCVGNPVERQDGACGEQRSERADRGGRGHDGGDDCSLGGEDRETLWHGRQGHSDLARLVLAADREDRECDYGDLGDPDAAQA